MSDLPDAGTMLEAAERAAIADDLASADELLRSAARIQEAELGPLHPDLANTLNNLAIVAEKTGRLGDAETFYRRAVAIASASFPTDHPMVAASRENLEAFCRARGLPIEAPALVEVPPPAPPPPPPPDPPRPAPRQPTPTASESPAPAPRRASRSTVWAAIGVIVIVLITAILLKRPWSSQEPSKPAPTPAAALPPPPASERALPAGAEPPALPAPIEQSRPPAVVPAGLLVTAQLCRTFSTSVAGWQCDPVGDPVSPGAIVLYTRVRSARDGTVVHRWYRGDTLRQSVTLTIRANATEGYRTYSRQTVDGAADWRVEVRSSTGDLLHERRFAVR